MLVEFVLIKAITTLVVVMGLAFIAENSSARIAGVLSGFPSGMAIIIFFLGMDNGTEFVVHSVDHTILGSLAAMVFTYVYYRVSGVGEQNNIVFAWIVALIAFLITGDILIRLELPLIAQFVLAVLAIGLFARLFHSVKDSDIKQKVPFTYKILIFRGIIAVLMVLFITGIAEVVGTQWAGVLSGFPSTFAPFLFVIHITYGNKVAATLLKNYILGIGASICYAVSVITFYPLYDIYLGTLLSLMTSSIYLVLYVFVYQYWKRKQQVNNDPQ